VGSSPSSGTALHTASAGSMSGLVAFTNESR
jgi:hypothetical protein